jgi:hypothetical protein
VVSAAADTRRAGAGIVLTVSESLLGELASCVVIEMERRGLVIGDGGPAGVDDGFLDTSGAADYLACSRKRIHDLTSMGVLRPDGRDGRRPLYLRSSLARYAKVGAEHRP